MVRGDRSIHVHWVLVSCAFAFCKSHESCGTCRLVASILEPTVAIFRPTALRRFDRLIAMSMHQAIGTAFKKTWRCAMVMDAVVERCVEQRGCERTHFSQPLDLRMPVWMLSFKEYESKSAHEAG